MLEDAHSSPRSVPHGVGRVLLALQAFAWPARMAWTQSAHTHSDASAGSSTRRASCGCRRCGPCRGESGARAPRHGRILRRAHAGTSARRAGGSQCVHVLQLDPLTPLSLAGRWTEGVSARASSTRTLPRFSPGTCLSLLPRLSCALTPRPPAPSTPQEHAAFEQGLKHFGTNWRRIQTVVPTRTLVQVSVAPKPRARVARGPRPRPP